MPQSWLERTRSGRALSYFCKIPKKFKAEGSHCFKERYRAYNTGNGSMAIEVLCS